MADDLFSRFGEVGDDLAAVDWDGTSLGPVESWPLSLRNVVRLMLGSRFPMWMAWGPELAFLCNDAYRRDTLGSKYPAALGRPASQVWQEIWPDIGPRVDSVISTGAATWDEGLLLILERSGYAEETYHTFSYSPIHDDNGQIAGMLCVVSEDTGRVIGQRRLSAVQLLGAELAAASSVDEVAAAAGRQLARDNRDLPFTIGYLFTEDGGAAELAWSTGIEAGSTLSPQSFAVDDPAAPWPAAAASAGSAGVQPLPSLTVDAADAPWLDPPSTALVEPMLEPGRRAPLGFLVAGLNPHRALDEQYRDFVSLIAGQVSAAVTRARAFDQERRRSDDLAALDAAKTMFFANVSHELRTPLTLLLGPAEDALRDTASPLPAVQRERVAVVQRNAETLLKLVSTLLDFSRLESEQGGGHFEPVDLARYTSELASMFDSAMQRAGLAYTIECDILPELTFVDREMWAKIVLNLVSNALKATFEGGIAVRLHSDEGMVELSVSDTGIGIPHSEQDRLFERFHRVRGAALRSHEGSGIGLALVAELAAVHGGTASVASEPGRGSTFTVRVPQGSAHLPADRLDLAPAAAVAPAGQYGAGYLAEAGRWLAEGGGDARAAADDSSGRPRVLVVDDNADMRDYIIGLLRADYQVVAAADGVDALELIGAGMPDLVLTDVMMPRLDGFGLLEALRSDPLTMHLPVVMLSARSGDEATVEGLDAGADDYLVKPFSARELLARVRSNLELDRVRRVADQLTRSQSLLDQAEQLAHVGSWEIDLRDSSVDASDEYFRILGVPRQAIEQGGLATALEAVEERDRQRLEAALQAVGDGGPPLDLELRLVLPDGTQRLVHTHGILQPGADGGPGFLRGSVQDVTAQRAVEHTMAESRASREAAAREHAIADELQRSLLPRPNFRAAGMRVAAYYRPGVRETQAGGDWYDVISLPGGRTALVIGDVMGRGVRAASVMGQLRATVQAYARLDLPPADVLRLVDAAAQDLLEFTLVTCVYAVFDPRAGTLTYANAGHMPPLLSGADGSVRRLTVGDPPLGGGLYSGQFEVVDLPPGASITLYTDGLVEHRGSDVDEGIDSLMALLGGDPIPAEARPTLLVESLLPHEPDDDVAVLTATVLTPDQPQARIVAVTATETGVSVARREADAALTQWGVGEDARFAAQVIVSELTANAVRHGRAPIELRLHQEGSAVVLEVSDANPAVPTARPLNPVSDSGRGLHLVEALSERWGTGLVGPGKVVWSIVRDA